MFKKVTFLLLTITIVFGLSCVIVLAQEDIPLDAAAIESDVESGEVIEMEVDEMPDGADEAMDGVPEGLIAPSAADLEGHIDSDNKIAETIDENAVAPSASDLIIEAEEAAEVAAEDLDIKEPGAFYWLKNIGWDIQAFFTRDPVKKSELKLKKASNQLLRARKLVKADPDDPKLQSRLEKISQKYGSLVEGINERIEKFRAENPEAPQLKDFMDKYVKQQIRHQEILGRIEEKLPEEAMERIRAKRQEHLDRFGEVMNRLQTKEEFKERLRNALGTTVEDKIESRARRMGIIEELGETATASEIRERIKEFKEEQEATVDSLKSKWQELQSDLRRKRQELREEVQQTREEIQEKADELKEDVEDTGEGTQGLWQRIRERVRVDKTE